jgi:hypothetical protein
MKRPRISAETHKYFAKKAIDNETTAEYEIEKALEFVIKNKDVLINGKTEQASKKRT